jgi:2-dehydropantoate 2-reductase
VAEPVLIWGGGAIGGTLAAFWARAGVEVLLVDVVADHVAACRSDGLSVEGPVESFRQVVAAATPGEVSGVHRRAVLAVKAQHTAAAAAALAPHLAPDGFVVSAQNGLNEPTLARILGPERVIGAFVNFGADWLGPGRVLLGNRGTVALGELDGSVRARTRDVHALFRLFEPEAALTDDVRGFLWGKLGYGAMLFATALAHESMAESFADPARAPVLAAIAREAMAVAAARGERPSGFDGFDPAAFMPGAPPGAAAASVAALAAFNRGGAKTHSGVWRDLAVRKRRTEVDAMVGIVAALGREAGVPTPLLQRLVALIRDVEEGRRVQGPETFAALTAP